MARHGGRAGQQPVEDEPFVAGEIRERRLGELALQVRPGPAHHRLDLLEVAGRLADEFRVHRLDVAGAAV